MSPAVASDPGSAVIYAHAGVMVTGNLDAWDTLLSVYVTMMGDVVPGGRLLAGRASYAKPAG
jgi:hypothetical protein